VPDHRFASQRTGLDWDKTRLPGFSAQIFRVAACLLRSLIASTCEQTHSTADYSTPIEPLAGVEPCFCRAVSCGKTIQNEEAVGVGSTLGR
jgi:hypothetical protein